MGRFQNISVFRNDRFSLGIDTESNKNYLSIPVSNGIADYEEYYVIPAEWVQQPTEHWKQLEAFAESCRHQKEDDKLILKPGSSRGVAF